MINYMYALHVVISFHIVHILLLYCSLYTYAHATVMSGPRFWGDVMQDLSLLLMISTYWIQIPIWPFHVRYAIRLVIHCSRPVILYCIGICIMHGLIKDEIQTCIQLIWVPMRLFHPYVPLHDSYIRAKSVIFYPTVIIFFYYGDLCTRHIMRSRPWINDSRLVPYSALDFALDSTFRFSISTLSSRTIFYK